MVLGVEGSNGGLSNGDEVVNVLLIGEVLVEVVLEVLNEVHVLLNEVVSSHSLESEGLVEELVGVDSNLWVLALGFELTIDGHSVVVVGLIEGSAELLKLKSELSLGVWNWGLASLEEDHVVNNLVWTSSWSLNSSSLSANGGDKSSNSSEFHFY